jgi:hypothetical protein
MGMPTTQMSPGLEAWGRKALDLGLKWFGGGNLTPFILVDDVSGKENLIDLQTASGVVGPELMEVGRAIIRDLESGQFYALGWDGYLTTDGVRKDAVFAEAGAGGEAHAFVFAQRYKKDESGELSKVGPPLVAAEAANLWARHDRRRPMRRKGPSSRTKRTRSRT